MAFVRPLYYNAGVLEEMTDTHIESYRTRCKFLFLNNPSVFLSVVASGGSLGNIADTRLIAGASTSRVDRFATAPETPNVQVATVQYGRVDETVESTTAPNDGSGYSFPLYYDGAGALQAMTLQDVYDTFAEEAILGLDASGELYTISTSASVSGYTSLGIIFSDTGANVAAYTAGGIPEAQDQPFTRFDYYLHQRNAVSSSYDVNVAKYDGSGVQEMTELEIDNILEPAVRHLATSVTGFSLRFSWNGTGVETGIINDTRLNGTGNYQQRFVNTNDYRTQEFPNGSFVTENTYELRVRKE